MLKKSSYFFFKTKTPNFFLQKFPFFPPFCFSTSKASLINMDNILQRLKINVQKSQQIQQSLIDASLSQGKININQDQLRIQLNKMAPLVSIYQDMTTTIKNLEELAQMQKQTEDKQQKQLLKQQIQSLQQKKQTLKQQSLKMLIPPDMYDDCQQITLQFRAGAGGSQSSIFVQEFSNMIIGFCESMGWKVTTISAIRDSATQKGYRILNLKVQGEDVYKIMKCESGVHKVIRVPETEAKGRVHSSTISMVVMPSVPFDFVINDKDIRYEYMRASGPGGQSVNKTESACRAVHIPTGMSVMNQEDRSQDRNRKRATDILKQRLFEIQYKKNMENQIKNRKSQIGTMDRSQKIRTYNFPQDRITDHRTGLTLFGIQAMMAGEYLQKFINTYQQKVDEEKLEALLQELKKK